MDSDASGNIEFEEFKQLITRHDKTPEQIAQETWKTLDADQSGSIDMEELKAALSQLGIRMAPWELRDMMKAADTNGDGQIDYHEFMACYEHQMWAQVQGASETMNELAQTWKLFDVDDSGNVDVHELRRALEMLSTNGAVSEQEAEEMLKASDNHLIFI